VFVFQQVPQEVNVQHSIEATGDVAGPSTPSQLTLTGKFILFMA
jgi:hypothetical protein